MKQAFLGNNQYSGLTTEDRFWEKVLVDDNNKCWKWIASKNPHGYGEFTYKHKFCFAHRYSWILHFGNIPKGLFVLHRCDNPSCVNPNHLFLGTLKDNTQDMIEKGRGSKLKGSESPNSKLTEDDVLEIRERYKCEDTSHKELANEYGVSSSCIFDLIHKRSWAWLD